MSRRSPPSLARFCVLALAMPCAATTASAIDSLTVRTGVVDGGTWSLRSAEGVVRLGLDDRPAVSLTLHGLRLPGLPEGVDRVQLHCDGLYAEQHTLRCPRGRVSLPETPFGELSLQADIRYQRDTDTLRIAGGLLQTAAGTVTLTAAWSPAAWSIAADTASLDLGTLAEPMSREFAAVPDLLAGSLAGRFAAAVDETSALSADATLQVAELAFSNEAATAAGEGLGASVELRLGPQPGGAGRRIDLKLVGTGGEAYFEPVYLDLSARPLRVESVVEQAQREKDWRIAELRYIHDGALQFQAEGTLPASGRVASMNVDVSLTEARLPAFYESYAQGFLVGTPFSGLETQGRLAGRLEIRDGALQAAELLVDDLSADDLEGRLAVYGIDGSIHWIGQTDSNAPRTRLTWDGGFVHAIGFGAASLVLATARDDVVMTEALRLPVLDGALIVDTFAARGLASDAPALDFDARLEPLELRRLTAALGWPAFSGTLSGELPMLSLRDGVITVGGSLVARAFDGTIHVRDLRVDDPFEPTRRASASIAMDGLDLKRLTEVFSFGHMEGRLDGYVNELQTFRGRPIAFDARFFTPANDRSRRRISRRALNNISDIAGGSAAVSTGLLGFFEEFSYSSLGIGCRLEQDVCHMSGIAPATNGYYLVRGRSLPRIDVIGHAQQVNWPQLLAQIGKAIESREADSPASEDKP